MNTLQLELESGGQVQPLSFTVQRMVNIGYGGRNQAAVQAHIEELRHQGVPPPPQTPYCIPVAARHITTDESMEVLPGNTSGEAEAVFFLQGGNVYVGVGSDHSDRDLEVASIDKAKQICPNFVSRRVWRMGEIAERWDDLVLTSHVTDTEGRERLYQNGTLAMLLPARTLLDCVFQRWPDRTREGLVIYSGTIPLAGKPVGDAAQFRCALADPATGRRLECRYGITVI